MTLIQFELFHNRIHDFWFHPSELIFLFTYFWSKVLIAGRKSQGPSGVSMAYYLLYHLPALRAWSLSQCLNCKSTVC